MPARLIAWLRLPPLFSDTAIRTASNGGVTIPGAPARNSRSAALLGSVQLGVEVTGAFLSIDTVPSVGNLGKRAPGLGEETGAWLRRK